MVNRNHATMFFTVAPKPDIDEPAAAVAYARACETLAALPDGPSTRDGYRLFWTRGDDTGFKDVCHDEHAVVGRHSACDVALPGAAELSLRHLLITATRLADGTPALRVLDLHASLPFYTDDGQPRRSIVATGPVVLRLGTYLFGGVPIGPAIVRPSLPFEMPRAVITHSRRSEDNENPFGTPAELSTIGADEDEVSELRAPMLHDLAVAAAAGSPFLSRVTVVPKAALLTDVAPPATRTAFARLTLLREGHSASIDLQAADLDAGVLIGRSERCTDGGLRRVLDGNISRVHALLLREGNDIVAYDLCSTQGTYLDGHAVRSHRISSAGGCVSLARTNPVMLCLHPRIDSAAPSDPGGERPSNS